MPRAAAPPSLAVALLLCGASYALTRRSDQPTQEHPDGASLAAWSLCLCAMRALRLATVLAAVAAVALALAWRHRIELIPIAARKAAKLDLALSGLTLSFGWAARLLARARALDAPFDTLTAHIAELALFTAFPGGKGAPPALAAAATPESAGAPPLPASALLPAPGGMREQLLTARAVSVRLERVGARRLAAHVTVSGLRVRYVAYDARFKVSNVSLLQKSLEQGKPPKPPKRAGSGQGKQAMAGAAQPQQGPLQVASLTLLDCSVHVVLNTSDTPEGARAVLPPILIEREQIDVARLGRGVSAGLLLWLQGLVLRTLAKSSVSALRGTYDMGAAAAEALVMQSLGAIDGAAAALAQAPLVGETAAGLLGGATGAARSAATGVHAGAGALVGGTLDGVGALAAGATTASPFEMLAAVHQSTAAVGSGVSSGVDALAAGSRNAVGCALRAVDSAAARVGAPGVQVVAGVTGATGALVGGATEAVSATVGGAVRGTAALTGGVVGGLSAGARAVAHRDGDELRAANKALAEGVGEGAREVAGGVAGAASALGRGVGGGAKALARGLGVSAAAERVLDARRVARRAVRDTADSKATRMAEGPANSAKAD